MWIPKTAIMIAALMLAACATPQTIDRTANTDIKIADAAATNLQFAYQRLIADPDRATPFATVKVGLACVPRTQMGWNTNNSLVNDQEFERIVHDEFKAAGYRMAGAPNTGDLFNERRPTGADFRIAGVMSKMKMNVCFPLAGFGDAYRGTGEASLAVEWQIYSEKTKAVVYRTSQTGFAAIDSSTPGVAKELIQRAFIQAVRGLLVDPGFRAVGARS